MRYLILLLQLAIGHAYGQKNTARYLANNVASQLVWVGHAQAGTYAPTGSIMLKSGELTFNNEKLSSARLVIDMATIRHENTQLQKHLLEKDFFAVAQYPEATFVLSTIKGNQVTGRLTIKGITRKVNGTFALSKENKRLKVDAHFTIDRTLFGIKYNSASFFQDLGSYAIKNEFELSANCVFELQE